MNERETITPPQLAARWGVRCDKVLNFINSGELVAINLAQELGGNPRYKIYLSEVERFEQSRSTKPAEKTPRRRRRAPAAPGKEYV